MWGNALFYRQKKNKVNFRDHCSLCQLSHLQPWGLKRQRPYIENKIDKA